MAIQINGFTITSLEKIHGYDRVSGVCEFLLDELKSAKIANTEDTTDSESTENSENTDDSQETEPSEESTGSEA